MAFDMSLVQRGARNRRTPYYEATQRYDPKGFTVYNHMYFPIRFDTFEAEFDALLNDVTLWDVSVERCLEIDGPDGFSFAQLLTPRDLSKCAVGQAKYVLICDKDGGIVNDPVLTRMDETRFWFALASSDALLFARGLEERLPDLDVDDPRGGRGSAAGPGSEVQASDGQAARRGDPGPQVLLLAQRRDRGRTRRGHAHRLDVGGRLRGVHDRHLARGPRSTRRSWSGAGVRHPADGPERHPAGRGCHLQLGRRHDLREQPTRDGTRATRRLGPSGRREPLAAAPSGGSRRRG